LTDDTTRLFGLAGVEIVSAQGVINPVPAFHGFPSVPAPSTPVTNLGMGVEADLRLKAASVTDAIANDVRAGPKVRS
jgi:hypothetical protein